MLQQGHVNPQTSGLVVIRGLFRHTHLVQITNKLKNIDKYLSSDSTQCKEGSEKTHSSSETPEEREAFVVSQLSVMLMILAPI